MGESKLPKPAPPIPKRPSQAIFAARSALAGWKSTAIGQDPDTDQFMRDLERMVAWIDELEAATAPFAAIVPLIESTIPDESPVRVDFVTGTALTVGQFRRLNPNAVAEAAKPPLNS